MPGADQRQSKCKAAVVSGNLDKRLPVCMVELLPMDGRLWAALRTASCILHKACARAAQDAARAPLRDLSREASGI